MWPVAELLATDSAAQSLPGLPAAADATAVDVPAVLAGREPADKLVQVLLRARDRENAGNALQSELLGSELANGELRLSFSTQLSVADPDELEKQRGYRELIRRTTARTTLGATAGGQPALVVLGERAQARLGGGGAAARGDGGELQVGRVDILFRACAGGNPSRADIREDGVVVVPRALVLAVDKDVWHLEHATVRMARERRLKVLGGRLLQLLALGVRSRTR